MECFKCKGELEFKKVNYIVDLEESIIIIKHVPAKVCAKCGEQYFDNAIAANIEKIVEKIRELPTEVIVVNYREEVA